MREPKAKSLHIRSEREAERKLGRRVPAIPEPIRTGMARQDPNIDRVDAAIRREN
jgi:hypothetical protein